MKTKNLITTIFFALIFILQTNVAFGQTRVITGTIFNSATNAPIPDIRISVKGTNIYTKSDNKGEYSLSVPDTMQTITFSDFNAMNVTEIKIISSNNINVYLSQKDIFDLTLEELMNIEVESSTKSSITIQKAPSSIKVFKNSDFEKYGFYTLKDILTTVPGMQIQEYRAGHQLIWTRGVQQRYNNKVLLLIDGVPMRDGYYGNFTIDESLPLENIEQIEIISGPGSVLYGTNSFSSVISITTKTEGKSLSAKYGSFNSMASAGEFSYKGLYANVNYFQTDGFSPKYNSDGYEREHPQNADNINAFLKYKSKGLTLIGSYASYNYPYKYRSSNKDYSYNRNPIYGAAGYDFDFKEKGKLSIFTYYNYFGFYKDKTKYLGIGNDTIKEKLIESMNTALFGGNIDYFVKIKKHDLLIGTSYQQDMALKINAHTSYDIDDGNVSIDEEILTNPDINRNDIAFYIQDLWNITDKILLTTGLRYDILSDFENQFNYRIGLTGQTSSNIYGKILYGTAYRIPSYREYLDIVCFNDNLQPEHLNTFELQAGYVFGKGDISITYFNNIYTNFIQELLIDSVAENNSFREVDDEMAFNFKKRSTSGLELNAVLYPAKGLFMNIGASYLLSASENAGQIPVGLYPAYSEQGNVDIMFLSDYTINLTTSYKLFKNYQIGVNAIYFSDRKVPADYQADVPENVKNSTNAKGFYKIDLFARAKFFNKLDFDLRIQNLLNEDIYSPPYGNSTGYDAHWTGLTFNIGLRYKFN